MEAKYRWGSCEPALEPDFQTLSIKLATAVMVHRARAWRIGSVSVYVCVCARMCACVCAVCERLDKSQWVCVCMCVWLCEGQDCNASI